MLFLVAVAAAECACNGTAALACAEKRMEPWSEGFAEARCGLWCCSQRTATALGWQKLAQWHSRRVQQSPWEPLLGMRSLSIFADGFLRGSRLDLAPIEVTRSSLVVAMQWPTVNQPNLTRAVNVCRQAATRLGKSRVLWLVAGDAAFPPRGFRCPHDVAAWATNVADDADDAVQPMPLGLSAGPNRAWTRTLRAQLQDKADASLAHRSTLLLCRGYRNDSARRTAIDALRRAGFDQCGTGDKAGIHEYWDRLKTSRTTFCPTGLGVATFRVYEALLAGSVPVFEAYAKHRLLFVGLPVIQVPPGSYASLTPTELQRRYRRILDHRSDYDLRRIFLPFWLAALARATTPFAILRNVSLV